jgi:hypothetical protein
MRRSSRRLLSILALAASFVPVHAAELGEARVSSHIGQPLVADIELAMIDDPAQTVSVRLASPEVYNGAGIAMPPVLAGVNLSVMRRDGRQFLHVTSLRPVDSEHLHLYLELADKGQRTVRLATLWLTPDPNPAPAQAAPAQAVPAPAAAAPAPVPAPAPAPARAAHAAPPAVPAPPVPPVAPVQVRQPAIPGIDRLRAGSARHEAPKAAPAPQPLPIHARQPAAPAVCEQQAEQARVCAALDGKNAALRERIGSLEGKVKSLQATLGAAPPAPASAPAPAPAPAPAAEAAHAPPGPKPISAIKPLVPRKPKAPAPEPQAALPWAWIGGGAALLLALGGAWLLLRRRARTVRNVDIPAGPRLIDRLRHSLPTGTRSGKTAAAKVPEAAAEAVEPGFD